MAYKSATNEAGEKVIFRSAKNDEGMVQWFPTDLKSIPQNNTPRKPGRGNDVQMRQSQRDRLGANYYDELEERGPGAIRRAVEAKNMPIFSNPFNDDTLSKPMVIAGRETDKLLSGLGTAKDALDYTWNYLAGDKDDMDSAVQSMEDRDATQLNRDKMFRELGEQQGLSGAAAMLPYMATGLTGAPVARKVSEKVLTKANQVANVAVSETGGFLARQAQRATMLPGRRGKLARRFHKESVQPRLDSAAAKRLRKANRIDDPDRKGLVGNILGDTMLGGVEGALHHDMDPLSGSIASLGGSATGNMLKPILGNANPRWDKPDQDVIDWADGNGYHLLPSMKTGRRGDSMFESGLRSDDSWTDAVHLIDRANDHNTSRIAYKAMGVDPDQITRMTPDQLQGHKQSLKSEYELLESQSVGRFSKDSMNRMDAHIRTLKLGKTAEAKKAHTTAQATMQEFKAMFNPAKKQRDSRGRIKAATFDGAMYKDTRRRAKSIMDTAYDNNRPLYDALKPMVKELDDAMELGLKDFGGEAGAQSWKDLNERYAMTNLVMNNGMKESGAIDLDKLGSHFMRTDSDRLLTESGGRVTELHKAVKFRNLERDMPGNANRTAGIHNPQKMTAHQKFLGTPFSRVIPFRNSAYMNAYMSGYPSVTGILNMSNKNFGDPALYVRATAMDSQLHPQILEGVDQGIDFLGDVGKSSMDTIMEMDDEYNEGRFNKMFQPSPDEFF